MTSLAPPGPHQRPGTDHEQRRETVWIIAGYITVDEDEAWRPQAHAPETGITLHEVDVTAYEVARARPPF
jgi:hypothetical protein